MSNDLIHLLGEVAKKTGKVEIAFHPKLGFEVEGGPSKSSGHPELEDAIRDHLAWLVRIAS